MKRDWLAFGAGGALFGFLVGWILYGQTAGVDRAPRPQAPQAQPAAAPPTSPPARLDEARARELQAEAEGRPGDAGARVALGNLYFDAERYDDAIRWYEQALAIDPNDVNARTDLAVCFYYTNQPDRALAELDKSLTVDPRHTKTLLNLGIVRAFGKQDLAGAAEAWQRLIDLAPDSPEGRKARQALDNMRTAHPDVSGSR